MPDYIQLNFPNSSHILGLQNPRILTFKLRYLYIWAYDHSFANVLVLFFKFRWMTSYRHSGQRSRVRKLQYIAELERTVDVLQVIIGTKI